MRIEDSEQRTAILDAVLAVAAETEATPAQVSVAWLRAHAARSATALVPVIGPRTAAQLREYLGALDVPLDDQQYLRLRQASAVSFGSPHEVAAAALPASFGGEPDNVARPLVPVR